MVPPALNSLSVTPSRGLPISAKFTVLLLELQAIRSTSTLSVRLTCELFSWVHVNVIVIHRRTEYWRHAVTYIHKPTPTITSRIEGWSEPGQRMSLIFLSYWPDLHFKFICSADHNSEDVYCFKSTVANALLLRISMKAGECTAGFTEVDDFFDVNDTSLVVSCFK